MAEANIAPDVVERATLAMVNHIRATQAPPFGKVGEAAPMSLEEFRRWDFEKVRSCVAAALAAAATAMASEAG